MKLDKLLEEILWEIEAAGKDCPESLRQFEEKIKKAIYIQSRLVFPFSTGEAKDGFTRQGLPTPNGSAVILIARMIKKERGYEND